MPRVIAFAAATLLVSAGLVFAYHAQNAPRRAAAPQHPVSAQGAHPDAQRKTPTSAPASPTAPVATSTATIPAATSTATVPAATSTATVPAPTAIPTATDTPLPSPSPTARATPTPPPPTDTPSAVPTATPAATATATAIVATATTTATTPATTGVTATATMTASLAATTPVSVSPVLFSLFTVNPRFTQQRFSFTLSAPARVRVSITNTADPGHPARTLDLGKQPAGEVTGSWNGRDNSGAYVPEGDYDYTVTATGADGQPVTQTATGLGITYKRIVVSLSKQQLWAFDGQHYVLSTLVTTGNAALPTPTGTFPILARYSPFTMVSPFPYGSPYYYAPSPMNFALLFDDRGYYVHDAPWRSNYGPGSNATPGTPGQNDTGSHGCVNVPYNTMAQLYPWATIGTIVQVVP